MLRANLDDTQYDVKAEAKEKKADIEHLLDISDCDTKVKKMRGKLENSDSEGDTRSKRLTREQEKLLKKQQKVEEQLSKKREKFEERLLKKQEKAEKRLLRQQENLTEKLERQQEKVERMRILSK